MSGQASPTGAMMPSPLGTYNDPELEKRLPVRPRGGEEADGRRRLPGRLRGHARLPEQPLHQRRRASASRWPSMWAQLNVKVRVNAMPRSIYFPKLEKLDTSMYMLGWGGSVTDAETTLHADLPQPRQRRRRRLQLRPGQQPEARRAGRGIEQGARSEEARGPDQGGDQASTTTGAPHPAAPPVHPVGGARERRSGAPRRQLARMGLGHDQVTGSDVAQAAPP